VIDYSSIRKISKEGITSTLFSYQGNITGLCIYDRKLLFGLRKQYEKYQVIKYLELE